MAIVFGSSEARKVLGADKVKAQWDKEQGNMKKHQWVECKECTGTGECQECHNALIYDDCDTCGGDGYCVYCDGEGEVEMVRENGEWSYIV